MFRKKTDEAILREINKDKEFLKPSKAVALLGILGAVTGKQLSGYLDMSFQKYSTLVTGVLFVLGSFIHWRKGKYRTCKYESATFFLVGLAFMLVASADYVVNACWGLITDASMLKVYIMSAILIFIGIVIGYIGVFREGGYEHREMLRQSLYTIAVLMIVAFVSIIYFFVSGLVR